jgi:hypothetical protein
MPGRFTHRGKTEEVFTKHLKAIEYQRIELKEELSALLVDHVDFAATIEKARRLMSDLPTSWNTINPLQRLVFLRFLVPDGLGYQNGTFGTPENPSGIRGIVEFFDPKKHVAPPTVSSWKLFARWVWLVNLAPEW